MVWLIAAMAVAVGLSFGAVTQDDAFISFRYAEHLTQGHGLVFNVGEWVEGYTNLLWTLMLAGAMALGGEPVICSTVMGLVALAGTIVATWRLGKGHGVSSIALIAAPLLVALDAQFILESVEGLETALFVWLVTLGTSAALHGGRWGGAHWFVLAVSSPVGLSSSGTPAPRLARRPGQAAAPPRSSWVDPHRGLLGAAYRMALDGLWRPAAQHILRQDRRLPGGERPGLSVDAHGQSSGRMVSGLVGSLVGPKADGHPASRDHCGAVSELRDWCGR
jgi:hypothetical protein